MKVEIKKKSKSYNEWSISCKGFTSGMVMSMYNALNYYVQNSHSSVASDVQTFLLYAIQQNPEMAEICKDVLTPP